METNPDSETLQQLEQLHAGSQQSFEPEQSSQSDIEKVMEPDQGTGTKAEASQTENTEESETLQTLDTSIEVDGKSFATEKEAYEYMQKKYSESETERLILEARQDAFQQALQMGQSHGQSQPAPEQVQDEDDSDEFYADPAGYMKKTKQKLAQEIESKLKQDLEQERQEQQLWQEFFSAHPDLDGFKQDCELVLNQNLETVKALASKDRKRAMDYLATKTREKFQTYMERMKPRKTLPNMGSGPSTGQPKPNVTHQKSGDSNENSLDFVSQLRSLRG